MYAFLLVLGAVATAAGCALVASGVPVQEFGLGSTLIITGTISSIGGIIIIGLGLAVRELQRIAAAVAARPMLRPARPPEAGAAAAAAGERASPPARIPFPPKPKPEPRRQAESSAAAAPALPPTPAPQPAAAEGTALDRLRQKFPSLGRIENAPVVEETEVSLSPRPPQRSEEYVDTRNGSGVSGRPNGAEPGPAAPRLEAPARPAPPPEHPSKIAMFDSFWPKDSRRAEPEAPQVEAAGPQHAPGAEPRETAVPSPPADYHPVSILKSGVVDGMAYTLYSDGSIEAQLPQGTVRFGSIAELRLHLEKHG
jgi:hypothetical protein